MGSGDSSGSHGISHYVSGHVLWHHFVHMGPERPEVIGCVAEGAGGLWDEGADFLGHAVADRGYFFLLDAGQWTHYGILLPQVSVAVEVQPVAGGCERLLEPGGPLVVVGGAAPLSAEPLVEHSA